MIAVACQRTARIRLSWVLKALGVVRSVWYARGNSEPEPPGRKGKPVTELLAENVRAVAHEYLW